jgi:hypothetical protein
MFGMMNVNPETTAPFNKSSYDYYVSNAGSNNGGGDYQDLYSIACRVPRAVVKLTGKTYIVESPGVYTSQNLNKKLGYQFSGIEFLEAGRYSSQALTKMVKEAVEYKRQNGLMPNTHGGLVRAVAGWREAYVEERHAQLITGTTYPLYYIYSYTANYLPVRLTEGSALPQYRKDISDELDKIYGLAVKPNVEEPVEDPGPYLIGERYIPFIRFVGTNHRPLILAPDVNFNMRYQNQMPGMKPSSFLENDVVECHPAIRSFDESSNQVIMFFYDTQEKNFVFDMYLDHIMTMKIRELGISWFRENIKPKNFDKPEGGTVWEDAFFNQITGYEYAEKLTKYFAWRGFASVTCPYAYHIAKDIQWKEVNATTREYTQMRRQEAGFYISVNHKNNPFIGWDGEHSGFITCKDDEKMTVMETAWCQRVSGWSYAAGLIDQKYLSWELVDWLVGPFAERVGAKFAESPMVFEGKKSVTKETKKSILQKLAAGKY